MLQSSSSWQPTSLLEHTWVGASPCSSLNKYLVTLVTNPVTAVVCGGEPHRQAVVWVEAGGGGVYGVGSMVLKD